MELKIGDLIEHKTQDLGYGIILSLAPYKGVNACKVEWASSGLRHIIDVDFLVLANRGVKNATV